MKDDIQKINFNLFLASYENNLEQIKLYGSLNGNINFALAGAVYGSHADLVKYLLKNGATDASGSLLYAKDIRIANILSKYTDFSDNTKFIKKIFSSKVSSFHPFYILHRSYIYEVKVDNIPMREDIQDIREIIMNSSDKNELLNFAHKRRHYDLLSVIISLTNNINLFFLDNENFLEYVTKFENIPNFIFAAEKYLRNNHMSIKKIDKLNEYSRISSCLARHYIKHNIYNKLSDTKLYRLKKRSHKIYNKYIKYDPLFIILAASYNKENKLLHSIPHDIFRLINSYI